MLSQKFARCFECRLRLELTKVLSKYHVFAYIIRKLLSDFARHQRRQSPYSFKDINTTKYVC